MAIFYWTLACEKPVVGPIYAFIVGLCLDLTSGKILGMSAGIFAVSSYFAIVLRLKFINANAFKKILLLVLLVTAYILLYYWELHLLYQGRVLIYLFQNIIINIIFFVTAFAVLGKLSSEPYNRGYT